jgi:hypothetical protein
MNTFNSTESQYANIIMSILALFINLIIRFLDFITLQSNNEENNAKKGGENPEKKDQLLRRILLKSPG